MVNRVLPITLWATISKTESDKARDRDRNSSAIRSASSFFPLIQQFPHNPKRAWKYSWMLPSRRHKVRAREKASRVSAEAYPPQGDAHDARRLRVKVLAVQEWGDRHGALPRWTGGSETGHRVPSRPLQPI